ncbi:hypothetical protein Caci_3877 [Catenulispora acidiphila DSM 44928]|uniref:DUF4238 domain-containing protein n=1 Tax=Catenulispora acidiphila (strain DSM 44928 / JCM 14897 / NBRC 102108 / NRRL B-24433 / ID139908) TaxID=479433 RepID=C7QDH3_CATAD|nr:DUF4238 domain-containing protein [Catenulispora acidiphila]ACU72766.1 hypothetical protein Caci_3877 [Catenulispora acidiphila DSM 44928]
MGHTYHHHLVPQMYLRNFADAGKLKAVARQPPHRSHTSSVKNACNEVGFYELPPEELSQDDPLRDGWDPEFVEKFLSQVEGDAAPIIEAMVAGDFPLSAKDRNVMSLFIALQVTRGWAFRDRAQQTVERLSPDVLQMCMREEAIRERLTAEGRPVNRRAIKNIQRQLAEVPAITLPQGSLVASAIEQAVETCRPVIAGRPWRLLRFDENVLLTSDQPVGLWAPGSPTSVGLATAKMTYMPLNRNTAIAVAASGPEKISFPGPARARQVNDAVARRARRWIFHHPDDDPLKELVLPPVEEVTAEIVAQRKNPDGTTEEIVRMTSRPKQSL